MPDASAPSIITRREAIGGAASALLSGLALTEAGATPAGPSRPPNVIVILADDLGYADSSLYRGGRFVTPHIDRLAASGARCTNGYSTAPVCAPSRAGLMTGRYQQRFGFEYNNGPAERDISQGYGLSTNEITFAQLLKQRGYRTGAVGKWHLGSQPKFYPLNRGFDEFVGFLPGETSYIDPTVPGVHVSLGPLGDELLHGTQTGIAGRFVESLKRRKLNQVVEGPNHTVVSNEREYLTDYWGERSADFIRRSATSGTPFFLYTAFNAVHSPHMVTEEYYARFSDIADHQTRVYAAMVSALDDAIGVIVGAVHTSGQAGNTMIFFGADHGCAMYFPGLCYCSPVRGGKLSHYEGGPRIPFVLSWPGHIPAGTVYDEPVSTLDLLPTALTAAGGTLPSDRSYDGVNLIPYLTGANGDRPHEVLFWRRKPLYSIRSGDWKLWKSDDATGTYGTYTYLFNLRDDPRESKNLAARNPQKVAELEALIRAWDAQMIDPLWPSKRPVTFDVCGTTFTLPV